MGIARIAWNRLGAAAGASLVVILAGMVSCGSEEAGSPLPKLSDLRAMKAGYLDYKTDARREFEVPREHWQPILDALSPARRDDTPAKWEVLGGLHVTKTDGQRLDVLLFTTSQGPGAFAVEKAAEKRVYYRGGKSQALVRALQAAYDDSRKAGPSGKGNEGGGQSAAAGAGSASE